MMMRLSGDADGPRHQTNGVVCQRITMEPSVDQDGQLELDPLWYLQPMQMCEEQRDVVVLRRGIHHHQLHPLIDGVEGVSNGNMAKVMLSTLWSSALWWMIFDV